MAAQSATDQTRVDSMKRLREELIRIHKKNYRRNLKLVKENLGYNPGIEKYEKEYLRHLRNYQEISSKAELIKKVMAADLVFHGDYHTLKQSQHSVIRVLREVKGKRDIIMCLEMFHAADQKSVDRFMAGELPEKEFLAKIDYARKWPFHWENWRPIIEFCRRNRMKVIGINTDWNDLKGIEKLRERDRFSARLIAKTIIRNPGKLVYVVDGDYHIAPNHLPREVEQLLDSLDEPAKSLIIFQNAENLYWKLCSQGLEEADVLKISENKFCVMNTMPANKIQSYLNWLEYSQDAYFPVHEDWEGTYSEDKGVMVHEVVSTLCDILDLPFPADALEGLEIYYPGDLGFMGLVHSRPEFQGQLRLIRHKIKREEGFLLEYEQSGQRAYLIYLANSNINMAAEEACHFLNAVLRGGMTNALMPFDRFYRSVITECIGFFGSKFINEKRKSQTENSLRILVGQAKRGELKDIDSDTIQVARLILQHFSLHRRTVEADKFMIKFFDHYNSRSAVSRMFSTQLGYMLGNKLYYAVKRGKFSIKRIQGLFHEPFDETLKAFTSYLDICERVKKVKHVARM